MSGENNLIYQWSFYIKENNKNIKILVLEISTGS